MVVPTATATAVILWTLVIVRLLLLMMSSRVGIVIITFLILYNFFHFNVTSVHDCEHCAIS